MKTSSQTPTLDERQVSSYKHHCAQRQYRHDVCHEFCPSFSVEQAVCLTHLLACFQATNMLATTPQECCKNEDGRVCHWLGMPHRNLRSMPAPCCPQDPEGILSAPKGGHIQRRLSQQQQQANEQYEEQLAKERAEARAALEAARAVRNPVKGTRCACYRRHTGSGAAHQPRGDGGIPAGDRRQRNGV